MWIWLCIQCNRGKISKRHTQAHTCPNTTSAVLPLVFAEDEKTLNNELHKHAIMEEEAVPSAGQTPPAAFCPLTTLTDKAA